MQEFLEGVEPTEDQNRNICRALLDLAAVDGVHESELALVKDFYGGDGDSAGFEAMSATHFDLEIAAAALKAGGDALVEAFLVSAYLLIYADGEHSDGERIRIGEYADALNVGRDRLEELHLKARLMLLQMFAQLQNKDAVSEVGGEMGLSADEIGQVEG